MLSPLERLHDLAVNENIDVHYHRYPSSKKGACVKSRSGSVVFLNKEQIDTSAEELCVLAEEIGHVKTGTLLPCEDYINPDFKRWLKRKNEIYATRWAVNELLTPCKIQQAINNGCLNDYEISEYCGVSEELLEKAFVHYRNKGVVFTCCET